MTAPSATAPPTARPRGVPRSPPHGVRVELAGLGAALALALATVAHLCLTPRAWMLFSDADSVLLPMMHASAAAGEPQRWALSSVLFLPERALYDATAALGLGVRGTLAVDGVINLVLLYAALRVVAALVRPGSRAGQVGGALATFAAFAAFTLLDSSPSWDSLELPSLLATTTYYSATVIATVLAIGLVTASVIRSRRQAIAAAVALTAVAALAVLTNPLFVAWAAVPCVAVLVVLTAVRRVRLRRAALPAAALVVGAALGFALRIPFAPVIVRDPSAYADPGNTLPALAYLIHQLNARIATPEGLASVAAIGTVIVLDALLAVRAVLARRTAAAMLLGLGAVTPLLLTWGGVLVGIAAARYLQPIWFVPLLPLVLAPMPAGARAAVRSRRLRPVAAILLAVTGVAGLAVTAATAATPDASIRCLDAWVTASGRTGAGLFETIRGPKAYLAEPRRLIQVDSALQAQPWLTNRADDSVRRVSFLVTDAATPPFATAAAGAPARTVVCGRYRVLDWERPVLTVTVGGPIVPPHPPSTTDGGASAG